MCIAVISAWPDFAVPDAVRARLGEQQRLVTGDVLKAREIRAQFGLAVQVHVERADVEEREIEKFGRWKVDVRKQAGGRGVLGRVVEVAKKILDPDPAVPADDASRNLIAKRKGQHRRMLRQLRDLPDDVLPDVPRHPSIVEERDMLRPRKPDHHAKPMARRFVQQIRTWRVYRCGPY